MTGNPNYKVRSKMDCIKVEENGTEGEFNVSFAPIYDDDPESDNYKFWKYTPCGNLDFFGLKGKFNFESGKRYNIDISLDDKTT